MTSASNVPQLGRPTQAGDSGRWDVQARGRPLLIFDGDCGFCTRSVEWLEERRREPLAIAPWQFIERRGPGLATLGLAAEDFERYAWWIGDGGRKERGHRAIGRSLLGCRGVWPAVGRLLLTPPFSWLAALGYQVVSRNRNLMPGGTPACKI